MGLRPLEEVLDFFSEEARDCSEGWILPRHRDSDFYLGRLALKEEGAGKVRVFAIADVVTQSFLEPLHQWIFK